MNDADGRYVAAVAELVRVAPHECSFRDGPEGTTALIPLDMHCPLFPERELSLLWSGDSGWSVAVATEAEADPIVLGVVGLGRNPDPPIVVRAAEDLVKQRRRVR